ncbi:MAG: hypothetical protein JNL10_21035 [Verrucomicrobiales bacterium]|nr:hypothetical protein [Verrucomicrobiales bacterium]
MAVSLRAIPGVGDAGDNPYGGITNRNAFGLRPPPEPETNAPVAPPAPPPNVFLTGVSHERGLKRAFFVINRPGAKTPDYETAVEGDEIQDLKVLEINARDGKVRVQVSGREVVLNFADNGMKSTAGTVAPPAPGRPGAGTPVPQPVAPVPQPTGNAGPVVIGRGGVNLNENVPAPSGGVPLPVTYSDAGGGLPASPGQGASSARVLPSRGLSRGGAGVQEQPVSTQVGGGDTSGSTAIPIPPPSRFAQ